MPFPSTILRFIAAAVTLFAVAQLAILLILLTPGEAPSRRATQPCLQNFGHHPKLPESQYWDGCVVLPVHRKAKA